MGPYYTGARAAGLTCCFKIIFVVVCRVIGKALGKARKNKTMTRENTQPYYTTSSVISSIYLASTVSFQ
jgi:hypothetical protein